MNTTLVEWERSESSMPVERDTMWLLVVEEAERIAGALGKKDQELTDLLADPAARLGDILEAKRDRVELSAYLKGLTFLHEALGTS